MANIHDPRQQVAYCGQAADVADVWVDGCRRVANGRLVDHDLAAPGRGSRSLAPELFIPAGLGEFSS